MLKIFPLTRSLHIKVNGETQIAVLKEGMFDPNPHSLIGLAFGSDQAIGKIQIKEDFLNWPF